MAVTEYSTKPLLDLQNTIFRARRVHTRQILHDHITTSDDPPSHSLQPIFPARLHRRNIFSHRAAALR